jgi:hypothetical protein
MYSISTHKNQLSNPSFNPHLLHINHHPKPQPQIKQQIIPLYIGFTTIPSRLEKGVTAQNLSKFLKSTFLPEKIILSIPSQTLKGNKYPLHLLQQEPFTNPRVHIHFVEKDDGPLLKLTGLLDYLYTNQIKPEYIAIMDDDILYPPNLLKRLWNQHWKYPNASVGFVGRIYDPIHHKIINHKLHQSNLQVLPVQFLETFHIALHPTSLFLDKYQEWKQFIQFQFQYCPDCIWTDDIVIGLWGTLQKIPKYIVKGPKTKFNTKNTPKLSKLNLAGRNDRVFQKIFLPILYK